MATGSGKTVVMAMLVVWQVLNKVTYPQDDRFSKHIFIIAPGLTVKSRLQVLIPAGPGICIVEKQIQEMNRKQRANDQSEMPLVQ